jgi:hypothetical protein
MQSEKDILNMVIDKFPEQANRLTMLFHKNEDFREVCEDYFLCKEAMNKIIITNNRRRKILKDYKTTLKQLEIELLIYLDSEIPTREN